MSTLGPSIVPAIGSASAGGAEPAPPATGLVTWLKPDPTTMWQDAAKTTPVTAHGDPVGYWEDQSGQGNHWTMATAANKPVWNEAGYVQFVNADFLSGPSTTLFAANGLAFMAEVDDDAAAGGELIGPSQTGGINHWTFSNVHYYGFCQGRQTGFNWTTIPENPWDRITYAVLKYAGTGSMRAFINNTQRSMSTPGSYASGITLRLGGPTTTYYWQGKVYGVLMYSPIPALGGDDWNAAHDYLGNL